MQKQRAIRKGHHRGTAMLCLALVLLLDVLAVSPEAHAWFHPNESKESSCARHDHSERDAPLSENAEHSCIVLHFAAGHGLIEHTAEIAAPQRTLFSRQSCRMDRIAPRSSRFLHPPGCGPPGAVINWT